MLKLWLLGNVLPFNRVGMNHGFKKISNLNAIMQWAAAAETEAPPC